MAMRWVIALLMAATGVVLTFIGGVPLDGDPTTFWQAAWLTVIGFLLIPASILVPTKGRISPTAVRVFDLLTACGSVVGLVLVLTSSMNFINDARSRTEAQVARSEFARNEWKFQQLVIEECRQDFGQRCSALRAVDGALTNGAITPLREQVDIACGTDHSEVASQPDVAYWLRSGCEWVRAQDLNRKPDWSSVDANKAGLRQFMGTIILAALLGFSVMRSVFTIKTD